MLQRSLIGEEIVTDFHHNRNTSYAFFLQVLMILLIRFCSCKIEIIRVPCTFIAILRLPSTSKKVNSPCLMM
jgi:hypothetical protein